MRVLMITQKLDPADPVLGFTAGWVRALLNRLQHLDVLCLERPPEDRLERFFGEYPPNLRTLSMGKERGLGKIGMARGFYRALIGVAQRTDLIFSHMVPRYTWMATPVAWSYPIPQLLWYTHRQDSRELRWAVRAARAVATAAPESFPFASQKVRVLGHGIDADFFAPDEDTPRDDPPLVVHVARLMPIKRQHVLLQAIAKLPDVPLQAAFVGAVPPGESAEYRLQLEQLAAGLGIADRVTFTGGLPPEGVRDMVRRATVAVNLSPPGLFDKAALESLMAGTPTIVATSAFDELLGERRAALRIEAPDDADGLANRLADLLDTSAEQRATMGADLRERTRAAHSLDGLMNRLVDLMAELAKVGRG
ncbi:MAG: glycosyltransferase family 4 protein [Anaerolineae bacterium]|nr:glycosyltransferase family 4 protein [Anaerolineae bacterium]